MREIVKEVTDGNTTVYYQDESLVAKVKGMEVGQEAVDIRYIHEPEDTPNSVTIKYKNITWLILCKNGKVSYFAPDSENESPEAMLAVKWCIVNGELSGQSKKRLAEIQKIYDLVYRNIMQIPCVQKHMKGLNAYLTEKNKEMERSVLEDKASSRKYMEKLKKEVGDAPDPAKSLIALVGSASK